MTNFYDLNNFPILTNRKRAMQVSSFDRKEENGDWGHFLYKDSDGSMVMLDETTPGCIRSFWAAVTTDDAEMKIYFDGAEKPKYTCTVRGFFNGAIPELSGTGNTFLERGQWEEGDCFCGNFFIPIPYEKGIKITVSGSNLDFYYHILYERFSEDSMSELRSVGVSDEFLSSFNGDYKRKEQRYDIVKTLKLEHDYTEVYAEDRSGVITEFAIEYKEDVDLSKVYLDIAFDNDKISQVACPLTHLFAEPVGYTGIETIAARSEKKDGIVKMYCYLPMPFWERASINLVEFDSDSIEVTVKLKIEENTYNRDECGLFFADHRRGATELFEDWKIGEFYGMGHVVGIVQTCRGGSWCEGNEHFYIDGELSPSINGTGTEDLYLGCYWPTKKYDSPLAGCNNNVRYKGEPLSKLTTSRESGYYRFFHDMPISFENGIKLMIQHGAVGQTYSYYSSTCFSYRQKIAKARFTDFIDVSGITSRKAHNYCSFSSDSKLLTDDEINEKLYLLCGKIEGDRKSEILSRKGLAHEGRITFTASIERENNGVVLRLLTDLRKGPMRADVYADGIFAGYWTLPEFNDHAPYGDYDFEIPASVTSGKESIGIEIVPKTEFADFEYKVMTRLK